MTCRFGSGRRRHLPIVKRPPVSDVSIVVSTHHDLDAGNLGGCQGIPRRDLEPSQIENTIWTNDPQMDSFPNLARSLPAASCADIGERREPGTLLFIGYDSP